MTGSIKAQERRLDLGKRLILAIQDEHDYT